MSETRERTVKDALTAFLEEECDVGDTQLVPFYALHREYTRYVGATGSLSRKQFAVALSERGFEATRGIGSVPTEQFRRGLSLKSFSQESPVRQKVKKGLERAEFNAAADGNELALALLAGEMAAEFPHKGSYHGQVNWALTARLPETGYHNLRKAGQEIRGHLWEVLQLAAGDRALPPPGVKAVEVHAERWNEWWGEELLPHDGRGGNYAEALRVILSCWEHVAEFWRLVGDSLSLPALLLDLVRILDHRVRPELPASVNSINHRLQRSDIYVPGPERQVQAWKDWEARGTSLLSLAAGLAEATGNHVLAEAAEKLRPVVAERFELVQRWQKITAPPPEAVEEPEAVEPVQEPDEVLYSTGSVLDPSDCTAALAGVAAKVGTNAHELNGAIEAVLCREDGVLQLVFQDSDPKPGTIYEGRAVVALDLENWQIEDLPVRVTTPE